MALTRTETRMTLSHQVQSEGPDILEGRANLRTRPETVLPDIPEGHTVFVLG
jgi:hypothetical protein